MKREITENDCEDYKEFESSETRAEKDRLKKEMADHFESTYSLKPDEKLSKRQGAANYIVRYIIYAVIFGFFVYLNISIIALLVGFLCHKLSIFVYALLEGRMDKNA